MSYAPPHPHSRVGVRPDGTVEIHAPAKLNLGLRVFPRRADGYHLLESWFVPISFYDTLHINPRGPLDLVVQGQKTAVPADTQANLVGKAATALFAAAQQAPRGHITLHKLIPPGGGLGGGSSDAAATLIALNAACNLQKSPEELCTLALTLGSDVPFFVPCVSALCRGRGEIMEPLNFRSDIYAVLLIPPQGVSTRLVYEIFDDPKHPQPTQSLPWQTLAAASVPEINATIFNDLAAAAFRAAPWLGALRDEIAGAAGQPVHLSGSGSALFTLFSSGPTAASFADLCREKFSDRVKVVPVRVYRPGEKPPYSPATNCQP